MNTLIAFSVFTFVVGTVGCSANVAGSASPVDSCSGTYSCTDGVDTVSTELVKDGDSCAAGELILNSDGTVGGIDNASWAGDSEKFDVCVRGGSCFVCTSGPPVASCKGKAASCRSHDPIGCDIHPGCFWNTQINYYGGTVTEICDGTAPSCASRPEVECMDDDGCTWQ